MTTVVNNPGSNSDSSGVNSLLLVIVLIGIVLVVLWFFGVPFFRSYGTTNDSPANPSMEVENNVTPPQTEGGTNIQIPDEIDVNVEGQ